MKKFLAIALVFLPLTMAGCKTVTTPQPLAPGYYNSADQVMGEVLAASRSFYATLQADSASGKFTPAPTEKEALNSFAIALNIAQATYLSYHNGTATQAQAQSAVNAVQAQQTALQSILTQGVK